LSPDKSSAPSGGATTGF